MSFSRSRLCPPAYGDCLLLHYGTDEKPGLILIDGGPGGVWERFARASAEGARSSARRGSRST